jgi:hypothetical protein
MIVALILYRNFFLLVQFVSSDSWSQMIGYNNFFLIFGIHIVQPRPKYIYKSAKKIFLWQILQTNIIQIRASHYESKTTIISYLMSIKSTICLRFWEYGRKYGHSDKTFPQKHTDIYITFPTKLYYKITITIAFKEQILLLLLITYLLYTYWKVVYLNDSPLIRNLNSSSKKRDHILCSKKAWWSHSWPFGLASSFFYLNFWSSGI